MIIIWLYIVNQYSASFHSCSKSLSLFIYLTSKEKSLPDYIEEIIDEEHVNSGFTRTCVANSEIVIYRKEEWFKVLIHETFHNFALDFSDMNTRECHRRILSLFKVQSEVNLFEAYTEFWAEIMNAAFCSFYVLTDKEDKNAFMKHFDMFITLERSFSFFQMVKALRFMGLRYQDLYSNAVPVSVLRDTLYKEKSNVLSYYIITTILMNNYQGFLSWCDANNTSLLQFKKTTSNLDSFCRFVERNHKTKAMLTGTLCMEHFHGEGNSKKKDAFIMKNMRMSICEMG
jgi:hypothetical protein